MLNNSALNVYNKRLFSTHLAKYRSIKFLYAINLIEIEVLFTVSTCMKENKPSHSNLYVVS